MEPTPDPKRRLMVVLTLTGLSLVPGAAGAYVVATGAQPTRSYAQASELQSVDLPAFVHVRVTPRPTTVSRIRGRSEAFLVHTEEGILLYVPRHHDLGQELAAAFPVGRAPDVGAMIGVAEPHEVDGALYEVGDYPLMTSDLPGYLIDDYAEEQGLPEGARMIEIDHGPWSVVLIGAMPITCCTLPLLAAGLFACLGYFTQRRRAAAS